MTAADSQQGRLFVVSAPSGTGKTTITSRLRKKGIAKFSVSHTTRPPREGEKDGESYFFISREEFMAMRKEDKFLEWAEVYGNFYGTSREWVKEELGKGGNVILELDVQGAQKVKEIMPEASLIFIRPPSLDMLAERLKSRDTDSPEAIQHRLSQAEKEIRCSNIYNYVIINDDLEKAFSEVESIIKGGSGCGSS